MIRNRIWFCSWLFLASVIITIMFVHSRDGMAIAVATRSVESGGQSPREQAVTSWEALVSNVIAQADVPAYEQSLSLKKAFDNLDKSDQVNCINHALHLISDEQFPALSAIIFDAKEAPSVLDAIFSDALNRSDGIKYPLMKELRKNQEHPMSSESAHLLDIVKPQDEKMWN